MSETWITLARSYPPPPPLGRVWVRVHSGMGAVTVGLGLGVLAPTQCSLYLGPLFTCISVNLCACWFVRSRVRVCRRSYTHAHTLAVAQGVYVCVCVCVHVSTRTCVHMQCVCACICSACLRACLCSVCLRACVRAYAVPSSSFCLCACLSGHLPCVRVTV